MKHTDIRELFAHADGYVDTTVTVCGWVRTARHAFTDEVIYFITDAGRMAMIGL